MKHCTVSQISTVLVLTLFTPMSSFHTPKNVRGYRNGTLARIGLSLWLQIRIFQGKAFLMLF